MQLLKIIALELYQGIWKTAFFFPLCFAFIYFLKKSTNSESLEVPESFRFYDYPLGAHTGLERHRDLVTKHPLTVMEIT